ncbi:ATP-binding cassette domain-containing protein [Enterococcus faecalis]|nr:ATP-binding cassette domain-containing protein [Enterococcus faecalis]
MRNDIIRVKNAETNNLKKISVDIEKYKLTVVVGASGSGKTSLVYDTIAATSRRALNSTFDTYSQNFLPKFGRPAVQEITNLPVVIVVDQKNLGRNIRSTLGTVTGAYTFLRLLYSRAGSPSVPHSDLFSFNNPEGMCPKCQGTGRVFDLILDRLIDFNKSLNEGAIDFPTFGVGQWRWKRYANSGLFDLNKKIKYYTEKEKNDFLYHSRAKLENPPNDWFQTALYEGIVPRFHRSILTGGDAKRYAKRLNKISKNKVCPLCSGTRINQRARECYFNGVSMQNAVNYHIDMLYEFINSAVDKFDNELFEQLSEKLKGLKELGLGYLTLNTSINDLSETEIQRVKVSSYLGNPLSDVMYVFDEPCAGLSKVDTNITMNAIKKIVKKGNTVLLVEHNEHAIAHADNLIDMGEVSGASGGNIVYSGKAKKYTSENYFINNLGTAEKKELFVEKNNFITLKNLSNKNLNIDMLELPIGALSCISGRTGSGKTALCQEIYARSDNAEFIEQKAMGGSIRSTLLTTLGLFDELRELFSKKTGIDKSYFSYNSKGACPNCKGAGQITLDMSFMDPLISICKVCEGTRYNKEVLKWKFKNKTIIDVLTMNVLESILFFDNYPIIKETLESVSQLGLEYITLNQGMNSLSGGENQRVKIAKHLLIGTKNSIIIIDSPLKGLHPKNVVQVIKSIRKLLSNKNTIIVADNNHAMIEFSEWKILLGKGGGAMGGNLIYTGTKTINI